MVAKLILRASKRVNDHHNGSRREEVLMWSVDEVDDGEEPPVLYFIATEAHIGTHNYASLGDSVARRRRLGMGCARQALPRCAGRASRVFVCADNLHGRSAVSPASALTRRHASILGRSRRAWRRACERNSVAVSQFAHSPYDRIQRCGKSSSPKFRNTT
jgi:hypothetical protein